MKKLSYEYVKKEFEVRNYILISKIYKNSKTNLNFICLEHQGKGIQDINFNNLKQGHGCRYCSRYESCDNNYIDKIECCILNIKSINYDVDVIIDKEDKTNISKYKWTLNNKSGYIQSNILEGKHMYLHRLIMGHSKTIAIDHINRNKLDNRKSNLRVCSNTENSQNRGMTKNNTSGFVGVSWHKRTKRWRSIITVDKKVIELGRFKNIGYAIKTRRDAELKYFGKFSPNYKHEFDIKGVV